MLLWQPFLASPVMVLVSLDTGTMVGRMIDSSLDSWDEKMMERDFLLTGVKRGQTSEAVAPDHFKTADVQNTKILDTIQRPILCFQERLYKGYVAGMWVFFMIVLKIL